MQIRAIKAEDFESWQDLRLKLWADIPVEENREFFDGYLRGNEKLLIVVSEIEGGKIVGFLEASIRTDYVEGCETDWVGYIEGWFVEADYRRQNVGRKLVEFAENWARSKGCTEMASDCLLDNDVSLAAHLAIGYDEIERTIHFKKNL
jgi:aminoglycoside 6'-N-acetyltransferase I